MLRLPESHQTSDMHDLSMIFDQQDLFTTNGAIDWYNCLDVISFSRTFNDFTFKLSTGFSSWNTRSFTKISTTTTSAWTQYRVSVSSQILSAIEQVLFELLSRINLCKRSSVFDILASSNKQTLITDKERTTNTKMKLQSGSKTRLIDRQRSNKSSRAKNSHEELPMSSWTTMQVDQDSESVFTSIKIISRLTGL